MTIASSGVFGCTLRPPTPPLDHDIDDALDFLNVDYSLDKPSSTFTCDVTGIETPPKSSPSHTAEQSSRTSKKVGFKTYTVQHEGLSPKKDSALLRSLPQLRDAKPLKSILKAGLCSTPTPEEASSPAAAYFSPQDPLNVPKMLASVVVSLASQDTLSRLDGYMTLNNALKAHEDFPAEAELREKLPRIIQCALRDLKADATSPQSKNITTQALTLVNAVFATPGLASEINVDMRAALFDLAMQSFTQDPVNKAVANRFLYLLAMPDFRAPELRARGGSQQKAETLVQQLKDIDQRISGNSVVAARLTVYQRLITQIPHVMLQKMNAWLDHVFHGCLSSNEEICKRAIQCGAEAGLVLGTHFSAAKYLVDLFAAETENGGSFGDYFVARLTDMATNKRTSTYASQIWSVVIMFFRNKRYPISQWRILKSLLLVIQRCLNSSDTQTKYQALVAWNRLVFVTGLEHATVNPPDRLLGMLKIPFTAALDVKAAADKAGPASRKTILAGYTNLLYYALQPAQSFERLDFFWDAYVRELVPQMLKYGGVDGKFANKILKALFGGPARSWSADRVLVVDPLDPDELVRLDAQWLRSRSTRILDTLESHYGASLCIPLGQSSLYQSSWTSLVSGMAEAGAQEVRVSSETKQALANLMNFFTKLWSTSHRWVKNNSPSAFIIRFGEMVLSTIDAFGPLAFLQENLSIDQTHVAGPAPTPSHRLTKASNKLQSPFIFLWRLLASPNQNLYEPSTIAQVATSILSKVFEGQTSILPRLQLLRQSTMFVSQVTSDPLEQGVELRTAMADQLLMVMSNLVKSHNEASDPSNRLSQVASVYVATLKSCMLLPGQAALSDAWVSAFDSIADHLTQLAGSAAVNVSLLEPMANGFTREKLKDASMAKLQLSSLMLKRWTWITSRQQLERSWKLLEGSQVDAAQRQALLDKVPSHLRLADDACSDLSIDKESSDLPRTSFLDSLQQCLSRCPAHLLLQTLRRLPYLLLLIQDKHRSIPHIGGLVKLCSGVLDATKALPCDQALLAELSGLLVAGLTTTHRSIANHTIAYWNTTFGQLEELTYPIRLASVLRLVNDHVDLDLPTFPTEISESTVEDNILLPAFENNANTESQEISEQHADTPRKLPFSSIASDSVRRATPNRPKLPAHASHTPKSAAMPPPKLRHEDSQIEFVTVQNLPSELTDDGSQSLTEHQREVRLRQQEGTARMFPQFSSSPVPPSVSKDIIRDRLAQVTAKVASGGRLRTPEIDGDEHGAIDTFLGSSPSQRSAQRAQSRSSQIITEPAIPEEQAQDDLADVPSSPPELADEFESAVQDAPLFEDVAITTSVEQDSHIAATQHEPGLDLTDDNAVPVTTDIKEPSTTVNHAALSPEPVTNTAPTKSDEFTDASTDHLELEQLQSEVEDTDDSSRISQSDAGISSSVKAEDDVEVDATRIEDSFAGTSDAGTTLVDPEADETTKSGEQRSGRSRKRKSLIQTSSPSKRQKKTARVKKSEPRPSAQASDDQSDMEDCIIVASQPLPKSPSPIDLDDMRSASQPQSTGRPVKRGRGRPKRFSVVDQLPLGPLVPSRELKRKASSISVDSTEVVVENAVASSVSSSPRKTRRTTWLRSQQEREPSTPPKSSTPVVIAPRLPTVVDKELGTMSAAGSDHAQARNEADDAISPDSQLREEAAAAARAQEDRVMLTPRSIIGRLKSILVDVKQLGMKFVLGGQEERELNGMLFELGGEVNAAGRRET